MWWSLKLAPIIIVTLKVSYQYFSHSFVPLMIKNQELEVKDKECLNLKGDFYDFIYCVLYLG